MGQNTGCHIHKNIKNGTEEEIDAYIPEHSLKILAVLQQK